MTIKAATKTAVAGVSIGVLTSVAYLVSGFLPVGEGRTYEQIARITFWWRELQAVGLAVSGISLLVFLVVLQSKQKEQP